ncbi:DUF4192 family protein [Dietzia sp. CQ4]|uniref:DUF4192 family protein n=1 Tax=Dietzia sp. (strain CQ4) TaxID=370437 RepID=UPI0015FA4C97|nr:DUF4192 family protein [Dietzia sp. CQ4]MBB1033364.1 DUF4192 family protein [Dietzia sp. CQ4]
MPELFRDRVNAVSIAAASAAVSSFYPTDAVVILSVEPESGRVLVGARADLDGYGDEFPEAVRAMVSQMPDAGAVAVVVFGPLDKAQETAAALAADLLVAVRVHLLVACTSDGVFAEEGGGFIEVAPGPLHESDQFAAYESVGKATRQTRADVLRRHQPLDAGARSALASPIVQADLRLGAVDSPAELLGEADALVARVRQAGGRVSDEDAALLGALCLTGSRRDALIAAIDREDATAMSEALRRLATRLAGPDAVPVLAVCGLAYWISGTGALAGVVVEVARQFGVTSTLLDMVDELRSSPVMNPAQVWPALRERVRASFE